MPTTARQVLEGAAGTAGRLSLDDVWSTTAGRHVMVDLPAATDVAIPWLLGVSGGEQWCYITGTAGLSSTFVVKNTAGLSIWTTALSTAQKVAILLMRPNNGIGLVLNSQAAITGLHVYFF